MDRSVPFLAFALNRCLFQAVQAADETGGVCYPECGDNQHGQSSVVSESEMGIQRLECALLMVETFLPHQGDLPWDTGEPFLPVSAPPTAPRRSRRGPPHVFPQGVLFARGYESVSSPI